MALPRGWTTNKKEWEEMPDFIKSADWSRTPFVKDDSNTLTSDHGVYLVTIKGPQNYSSLYKKLETPLYIGKGALKTRFNNHLTNRGNPILTKYLDCYSSNQFTFHYIRLSSEQAKTAEAVLIDFFNPPCNRIRGIRAQVSGGESISSSFP